MSGERSPALPMKTMAKVLPGLVAVAALLVYLGTLNHWISLFSLGTVARVSGWIWQPQLQQPLNFLGFYPFRYLPEASIPLALNVFSAVAAALVLLLLTRSVALLPHDRTREQRWRLEGRHSTSMRRIAWVPPVLAAMTCGLQRTFWEDATSATGNMISLLIFAGALLCLLEFRTARRDAWLCGGAILYGAGTANDWTMVGLFPVFLVAILWLKGFAFFDIRFLLWMVLCGLAGLSLYLVLPAVQAFNTTFPVGFWAGIKANLRFQRSALSAFSKPALLVFALTCLLPLLIISIRWKSAASHTGDDNPLGVFITKAMFWFVHASFLAVSIWMAFDPPLSLRYLSPGARLLGQSYLSALVVGYCSGYLLLVGSVPISKLARFQRFLGLQKFTARLTVGAFWLLLIAVPVGLGWHNLSPILTTNGPGIHTVARQLYESLPAGRSVVLSDDPILLLLVQAELGARRHDKDPLLLEMPSLSWMQYQIVKARQYKSRWPGAAPSNGPEVIEPARVLNLLSRFASREQVVYLHPSFSYCFEEFNARPDMRVLQLVPRTRGARTPPLDSRIAAATEQYWQDQWGRTLQSLAGEVRRQPAEALRPANQLAAHLRLTAEPNRTVLLLGAAYAKSLNDWGVQMQRLGHWKEAAVWFERALSLKPDNLAARINLEFNERYQRGDGRRLDRESVEKQLLDLFARYRSWERVINDNGPVDEPTFLFETARVLLARGEPRQAIEEFARCAELAPDWLEPKLWQAQGHIAVREFASASRLTEQIEAAGGSQEGSCIAQFLFCRAAALAGLGRTNEAAACIERSITQHPEQPEVLSVAVQLYLQSGQYQPALTVLDRLLAREPRNPELLSNKGLAETELARYDAAIATLTTALTLAPSNSAVRLNRAIANLRAGRLDAAEADYQPLLKAAPNSYKVLFGLGEIAWRKRDTNAAIRFYQDCLARGNPASAEHTLVAERLKQLKDKAN
jgi:tetratricopeptide (TPR) repeat protein